MPCHGLVVNDELDEGIGGESTEEDGEVAAVIDVV